MNACFLSMLRDKIPQNILCPKLVSVSPFKGIKETNGLLRPENWNFYLYYSHIKFLIQFNLFFFVVTELKSRGYTEFEWLWNLVVTSRRNFVFVPSQFDYIAHATSSSLWFRYLSFFVIKAAQTYICGLPPQAAQEACFLIKKLPRIGKKFWRNYMWKCFWVWKCFECRIIKRKLTTASLWY